MDCRKKVINAIRNRAERIWELTAAENALIAARQKAKNADVEVVRQIKNLGGRPVVFDGHIYTAHEGPITLTVIPCEYEILSTDGS